MELRIVSKPWDDLSSKSHSDTASPPIEWFRFILPIFLHVGIVHLLLNMLAQLTIGAQVEREMGEYRRDDRVRIPITDTGRMQERSHS
jgi:membrane associated rhomboid family serine protease